MFFHSSAKCVQTTVYRRPQEIREYFWITTFLLVLLLHLEKESFFVCTVTACSSDMHSRDQRDHHCWRNSTAGSVICLDAADPLLFPNSGPWPFRGWSLCIVMAPAQTSVHHTYTHSNCTQFLWYHDLLQKVENLHNLTLTSSILHPFGSLPEQMAAAAWRSLLVPVKVMLSGISSSLARARKCSIQMYSLYVMNKKYAKLVD